MDSIGNCLWVWKNKTMKKEKVLYKLYTTYTTHTVYGKRCWKRIVLSRKRMNCCFMNRTPLIVIFHIIKQSMIWTFETIVILCIGMLMKMSLHIICIIMYIFYDFLIFTCIFTYPIRLVFSFVIYWIIIFLFLISIKKIYTYKMYVLLRVLVMIRILNIYIITFFKFD